MLYIDDREPVEIISVLKDSHQVHVKRLYSGDYVFSDIAIERKTMNDFFSSLVSRRLFEQLSRMKRCYKSCYLIIEGFELGWIGKAHSFYSVILGLMESGIGIIFYDTKERTAEVIFIICKRHKSGCSIW